MKKIFIILIVILLSGCQNEVINETNIVNDNELVVQNQIVNGLEFTNVSLVYEKGIYNFQTDIKNVNNFNMNKIKVIFKTNNKTEIVILEKVIHLAVNDEMTLSLSTDVDLTSAYIVEYVIE